MAYRSRGRNNYSNNYCSYNSPGYGYGVGSCNNYSSSYSYGGNSSSTFSSGFGRSSNNGYSIATPTTCKQCLIQLILTIVVLVITFGFTGALLGGIIGGITAQEAAANGGSSSGSTTDPSALSLSPGVTLSVSFGNAFFCNDVTMEVNGSARASVYLITDTPPLTHRNSFMTTNNSIISLGSFRSWKYHLFSGTNVSVSIYIQRTPSTGRFSVYRGLRNFRLNRDLTSFTASCTEHFTHQISFQVEDENDYYFVYRGGNSLVSCSRPGLAFSSHFQVRISASWFVHSTAGLTNALNCSASTGGQCSLNVPADSNYRALIVTDLPTDNPDLSDTTRIRLQCSSTRGWAYAVVVLVPLLLVIGVTITTVILLVVCCKKRATCCSRHNTQTTTTTTTTEAAPTSAVQLQEMSPQDTQPAPASVTDEKDNKTTSDLTAAPPPSYKDSLDYPAQKTDSPPVYTASVSVLCNQ